MAVKHNLAHEVDKGDARHNGPFLDDIRAEQERAYREARMKAMAESEAQAKAIEQQEEDDEEILETPEETYEETFNEVFEKEFDSPGPLAEDKKDYPETEDE